MVMSMVAADLGLVAATEDCIEEASITLDRLKSATCSQESASLHIAGASTKAKRKRRKGTNPLILCLA